MSLDATIWAWRADVDSAPQRLTLLSLADRAGEDHKCYPSLVRLVKDTKLNRKTLIKVLDELELKKYIKFTGEIRGNGVKVYQLIGITGRENLPSTSTEKDTSAKNGTSSNLGTGGKNGTSTKNDTSTSAENGTATSTKNGTENLPVNLPLESKNKKSWLCLKKLQEEIFLSDSSVDFVSLIQQRWYHRELQAFENHNADKTLSDEIKIYHFADWLLNAKAKYEQREKRANVENQKPVNSGTTDQPQHATPKKLSDGQRSLLATRLADHSEFSSNHIPTGYGYTQALQWINQKLADPESLTEWAKFIRDVGFGGCVRGVAA